MDPRRGVDGLHFEDGKIIRKLRIKKLCAVQSVQYLDFYNFMSIQDIHVF